MKRKAAVMMLLAALGGWGAQEAWAGKFMAGYYNQSNEGAQTGPRYYANAANYVGPGGQPVPITTTGGNLKTGADYAKLHLSGAYPPEILQQVGYYPSNIQPVNGPAPGAMPGGSMMPPGWHGGGPPMGGPPMGGPPMGGPPGPVGAVAGVGMLTAQTAPFGVARTEVRFVGPAGMKISWYAPRPDGKAGFTPQYLEAPARYNFLQASIYRLKLSDIPNRAGVDLYPTLEVVPSNVKTATFLAHSAVPISFTEEDLEQVAAGNFVVKVIYLPDPQYQDLAATGPDEVVSSRLEPGVDPITEAKRRGSILAVVRLGNIDLEAPNTPAMDAPDPNAPKPGMMFRPGMMPPGMMPPGMMMPGMMPPGMMPPGMMPPTMPPAGSIGTPPPGATTTPTPTVPGATTTPKPPATSTGTPSGKAPTSGGILPMGLFGSSSAKK